MTELTPFAIYLIFTADDLRAVFGISAAIIGGVTFLVSAFFAVEEGELPPRKFLQPVCIAVPLLIMLAILTPSTKTLVAMYGIPAAIEGAKSAATSEVGQKAYSAVNKLLDGYLSDKSK